MRLSNKELIIATRNKGKLKEFDEWFAPLNINVKSLESFAVLPEIVEDEETFALNALKKAKTIADFLNVPVLADDSGLCVEALGGKPGVYSARYAGAEATDEMNNHKLLNELKRLKLKTENDCLSSAQFVCALVLFDPVSGQIYEAEGTCLGYITDNPRGSHGFGYDPLFFLPAFGKTMAEISPKLKNQISHRSEAIHKLSRLLK